MNKPSGYTRDRIHTAHGHYIAKDDGSDVLMLKGGEWVKSDGKVNFLPLTRLDGTLHR